MLRIEVGAATDIGRHRKENQDFHLADEANGLFLVADGMGGHAGGEVASQEAAEEVRRVLVARLPLISDTSDPEGPGEREQVLRLMREAIQAACAHVYDRAQQTPDLAGMGTTLTVLLLRGARAYVGHVGDSRAYLVREGKVHRLTDDHRVVEELLRRGAITPEEAATFPYQGALSRCVGVQATVQVDVIDLDILEGDRFLLCSDGLHQYLDDGVLHERLETGDCDTIAEGLVAFANESGGSDNITAIVIHVAEVRDENTNITSEKYRRMELIRRIPIFSALDYKELVTLLSIARTRDYQAGDEVLREGDVAGAIEVILYGGVRVLKGGQAIGELGPEAQFGEEGLLDGATSATSLVALEVTRTFQLDRMDLLDLMKKDPFLANKVLRAVARSLGDKFRVTAEAFVLRTAAGNYRPGRAGLRA